MVSGCGCQVKPDIGSRQKTNSFPMDYWARVKTAKYANDKGVTRPFMSCIVYFMALMKTSQVKCKKHKEFSVVVVLNFLLFFLEYS